jgi:hypothetical protein
VTIEHIAEGTALSDEGLDIRLSGRTFLRLTEAIADAISACRFHGYHGTAEQHAETLRLLRNAWSTAEQERKAPAPVWSPAQVRT